MFGCVRFRLARKFWLNRVSPEVARSRRPAQLFDQRRWGAPTMATITDARAYLVDLEVETVRTDAVQSFLKQETVFVEITTDDGLTGTGYSYTIGTGGRSVLAMLTEHFVPQLRGS